MSNGPNSLRPYQTPDNGLRQVPFSARNARWATGVGEAPFVDRKVHTHHTQQSHYVIRDVLRLIVCSSELFAAEMVLKHFLEIGLAHALLPHHGRFGFFRCFYSLRNVFGCHLPTISIFSAILEGRASQKHRIAFMRTGYLCNSSNWVWKIHYISTSSAREG